MEKIDKLIENIAIAVEDNINNKKLQKELRDEFIRKNLPETVPNQLFSDTLDNTHLEKNWLIAIAKVFRNELNDEKFSLTKYFTEGELFSYDNKIKIDEEIKDYILFEDIKQISNKDYLGVMTGDMAVMIRKNGLYSYYREFQRSPKLVKTSSGRIIKKIDANVKNILDMEEEFLKGTMRPTTIHFGILVKNSRGITENFKFKKMYKNIGDMWIKPDVNFDSETYLPFLSVDGWHRFTAMANAVEKAQSEGKNIDAKLGCMIHIFDNDADVKKFVVDSFKRVSTDLDYLDSINPSDENTFIDGFEKESKWLNGNVALTKQEMKIEKNLTEQKILIEAFKKTDIEMNDSVSSEIAREKIAKIVDDILDFTLSEVFNGEIKAMKNSIFLEKKIFMLYIKFASLVKDKKYSKDIYNLIEYINNNMDSVRDIIRQTYISNEKINSIISEVI